VIFSVSYVFYPNKGEQQRVAIEANRITVLAILVYTVTQIYDVNICVLPLLFPSIFSSRVDSTCNASYLLKHLPSFEG
jgi:hypothetical protein